MLSNDTVRKKIVYLPDDPVITVCLGISTHDVVYAVKDSKVENRMRDAEEVPTKKRMVPKSMTRWRGSSAMCYGLRITYTCRSFSYGCLEVV